MFLEGGEGIVEGGEFAVLEIADIGGSIELDLSMATAADLGVAAPGVIDKEAAHAFGGDGDEVLLVFEDHGVLGGAEEVEVDFVDEGGGLEGVIAAFALHVMLGEFAELGIDERHELVGGVLAAPFQFIE